MADTDVTFVQLLQTFAAAELHGGHPEPEELIEYDAGNLSEEKAQRVRAHLAICTDCAQEVLDLATFPEVDLRNEALRRTREQEANDWQAIQEKMALDGIPSSFPLSGHRKWSSAPWIHRLAACLVVGVLSLSLWVVHLERKIRRTYEPRANIFIEDLLPATAGNARSASAENTVSVPAGVNHVVLILALADFEPFTDYQVKILDTNGALRWSQAGIVRMPDGSFTLEIERTRLPSGGYLVQLLGSRSGKQKLLATYPLRITYASSP